MASTSLPSAVASSGFAGTSTYAADLQTAISRSVGFASLPLHILQNQQNDLNSRQSAVSGLANQFQALQSSIDKLGVSSGSGSYAVTLSQAGVVTANLSSGATAGTYSVNVTNVGSQSNTLSAAGLTTVTDPNVSNIDSASSYTLSVDGKTFNIQNTDGTLAGLAKAINSSSASVQATVVNIGGSGSPDYRLSVQGQKYAPTSIQLSDGSNPALLNTLSLGSNVAYQINGQSTNSTSDSKSITLSTGVSLTVLQAGTTNITVAQSATNISSALSSFATAYNNAFDELAKSRGQGGGALTGDSLIGQLSSTLHALTNSAQSSGNISSIEDLGLSFGKDGHLAFDSSVLSSASPTTLSNAIQFIGSSTSGGFLQKATGILTGLNDSSTGLFASVSEANSSQLSSLSDKISADQDRISKLQANLTARMAKADALISSLQAQSSYYTNLYQQMRANSQANG